MLERVLRITVSFPPLEMYYLFHSTNLLQNLSSTPSQTETDLKGAPNGRPKNEEGTARHRP